MNIDAWSALADRSRALVQHASQLMSTLTQSAPAEDGAPALVAARAGVAVQALLGALALAPELAAHHRVVQRFDDSLSAWQRNVGDGGPFERRYQVALLQQAAQALTSCLHVEALALSERARIEAAPFEARRPA